MTAKRSTLFRKMAKCERTVLHRDKSGGSIRNVDQYWSKDGKLLAEKDIIRDMEVTHGKIEKQK